MADKAAEYMMKHGVKFMIKAVPTKVSQQQAVGVVLTTAAV